MAVRVYVTGRVRVEFDGRVIDERQLPARQGRILFAYLVCHRQRPVTRDELAAALWPGALPPAWDAALNALISKLRALLKRVRPPSRLSMSSALGAYLLHVGEDTWIDREAAAEAIEQAEGFLRANRWRDAWAPSNIAAITARQPLLAREEGEWIEAERARLHGILVRALDCLSKIWFLNGEPSLALGAAREAVQLEPFREAGYRRLMRLHTAIGNRAEALRVYESCRALLKKELDTDPSRETQAVYHEVSTGLDPPARVGNERGLRRDP